MSYAINKTFIVQTVDNAEPTLSACTGVYSNAILSCSGNTSILLDLNTINVIGDIFTNNNVNANTITAINYFSGSTQLSDVIDSNSLTGGTYDGQVLSLGLKNGSNISVSGFTDIFVTGGTYSNGDILFINNTGGTFNVTGLFTGNTDVFVTGGTYNSSTGIATFINNTGGTFNLSGFSTSTQFTGGTVTGSTNFTGGVTANTITSNNYFSGNTNLLNIFSTTDYYTTGATFNDNNKLATFTRNDNQIYTLNLSALTNIDTYVTGFSFSSNTFYINQNQNQPPLSASLETISLSGVLSAATFNITTSGDITAQNFYGNGSNLSGITTIDTFTTGFTYNNNVFTIFRNQGQPNLTATISTMTGLTVSGELSSITLNVSTTSNLNGSIVSGNLSGSTDRIVEVTSGGTFFATKQIISAYLQSGSTIANLLDNYNNWDINGVYTGVTITGTFQGQKHYNNNYFFEAIDDNLWIRLIRG
jgi:hypothetical protein